MYQQRCLGYQRTVLAASYVLEYITQNRYENNPVAFTLLESELTSTLVMYSEWLSVQAPHYRIGLCIETTPI